MVSFDILHLNWIGNTVWYGLSRKMFWNGSSYGFDHIPVFFSIKIPFFVISSLTYIVKLSNRNLPDCQKTGGVIAVPDPNQLSNNRSITIPAYSSKIFE